MPLPAPHWWRNGLVPLAAILLSGLLALAPRREEPGPGQPPRFPRMEDWDVADLVRHLESRGLKLHALPTFRRGSVGRNAFLSTEARPWADFGGLIKDPQRLAPWTGVVYCERLAYPEGAEHLSDCWGDACLWAPPFMFFGDATLRARIRDNLQGEDARGRALGG
jgi:hypothetical protein